MAKELESKKDDAEQKEPHIRKRLKSELHAIMGKHILENAHRLELAPARNKSTGMRRLRFELSDRHFAVTGPYLLPPRPNWRPSPKLHRFEFFSGRGAVPRLDELFKPHNSSVASHSYTMAAAISARKTYR